MRKDPKARKAIQTEADPIDRAEEHRQSLELRGIRRSLESIDGTLKLMLVALEGLATPPTGKATKFDPTVTEIPKP